MVACSLLLVVYSIVILFLLLPGVSCNSYNLQILQNPGLAYAGQIFGFQPVIQAVDSTGTIANTFVGYVYVNMEKSPSGYEKLYYISDPSIDGCDVDNFCGAEVKNTVAMFPITQGIGVLKGLLIKKIGSGYTLKFILVDAGYNAVASISSKKFNIEANEPFKIAFVTYPGSATGGLPFAPFPVIGITDRGSNPLVRVNGYYITATIGANPQGAELFPKNQLVQPIQNGYAYYSNLYIGESGKYTIHFTTNMQLKGTVRVSTDVLIGVGLPALLTFRTKLNSKPVIAGEFFRSPPGVEIRDAGGNLVYLDSTSAIRVSIAVNPAGATLFPLDNLFVKVKSGFAPFSSLILDKAGSGFQLRFQIYSYNPLSNTYSKTSVSVLTDSFDVLTGPGRALQTVTKGDIAWAGGQPMTIQPVLKLVDFGGNILKTDSNTVISAGMLQSLATSKVLVISTLNSKSVSVIEVSLNVSNGVYGAGQSILFKLTFNSYISCSGKPFLVLNAQTASSQYVKAGIYGKQLLTPTLTFLYHVQLGDSLNGFLKYSQFNLNGSKIYDGNNANANLTLPQYGITGSNKVIVDTTSPQVLSMAASLPSGSYGVGQVINFLFTCSQEVVVIGEPPYILLNILTSSNTYAKAMYLSVQNKTVIVFTYTIAIGDSTVLYVNLQSPQIIFNTSLTSIRRLSDIPVKSIDTSIPFISSFVSAYKIQIDQDPPKLDANFGLQANIPSGTLYAGDTISLFIKFDKKVALKGSSITLSLADRVSGLATFDSLLPDEQTMKFSYTVNKLANASALNIVGGSTSALTVYRGVTIRRLSTYPTTDANIDTSSILTGSGSLPQRSNIVVDGAQPVVQSIKVLKVVPTKAVGSALRTDDVVHIAVTFSIPIVATCSPVFTIQYVPFQGATREAVYLSGNGSRILVFKYTVRLGDTQPSLNYRFTPNALCPSSGCLTSSGCNILASSANPSLAAILNLPQTGGSIVTGVPFSNYSLSTTNLGRKTELISIRLLTTEAEVGAGTPVYFEATFTDAVFPKDDPDIAPSLYVNIQTSGVPFAKYDGGMGTNVLQFIYTTIDGDSVSALNAAVFPGRNSSYASTPFWCDNPPLMNSCRLTNIEMKSFINLDSTNKIGSSNTLVNTLPPVILDVYSDKGTSPYDGSYTVGEEINIYVVFSKTIIVFGVKPTLLLDVGSNVGVAMLSGTNQSILIFTYTVSAGDSSDDLMYSSIDAIQTSQSTRLLQFATIPTTQANLTLPNPRPLSRTGYIKIDTTSIPQVEYVSSISSDGRYAPGDTLYFEVKFTAYVVVTGLPFFKFNMGGRSKETTYLGDNMTVSQNFLLPSKPSKLFFFSLTVAEGDFSEKLDYVDMYSFYAGLTLTQGQGSILQASTKPTTAASLILPIPGLEGSVSNKSTLYIDGSQPYASSIEFVSPPGVYGHNEEIVIALNFSTPVVVKGVPSIKLNTGAVTNYAYYSHGSGSNTMFFTYYPAVGDTSPNLDYIGNREDLLSAQKSFLLNGGWIRGRSESPIINALVQLNPPGGALTGAFDIQASLGFFYFKDLAILTRGPDYILRFTSEPIGANRVLMTTQTIYVSFSTESSLRPSIVLPGDHTGWSSAIQDSVAIIGAPHHNLSSFEVQTVSTRVAQMMPLPEVQQVAINIDDRSAIQTFFTSADVGVTIGGYFKMYLTEDENLLTINSARGKTQPIPANADPIQMSAYILQNLGIGNVSVTREPYIFCACNNAFKWTITFLERTRGYLPPLGFDTSELTGKNAIIVGPEIIQGSAFIGGTFTLQAFDKVSDPIPFDADDSDIMNAVASIGLPASSAMTIMTADSYISGARSWKITFEAFNNFYDVPLLISDSSALTGGSITMYQNVLRQGVNGPTGIGGEFRLVFRNHMTSLLPYNCSAEEMTIALEMLPVINDVTVSRSDPTTYNEYTWLITFIEVLTESDRGFLVDGCTIPSCPGGSEKHESNLEPLNFVNKLIGTNATIIIGANYGMKDPASMSSEIKRGSFGTNAGRVYVYQVLNGGWVEAGQVVGKDTGEGDQFGWSVDVDNDLLVVGAVSASTRFVPEIQSISCSATGGFFRLSFRGWTTAPISANVDLDELKSSIVSNPFFLTAQKLYTVDNIDIQDWGGGPFCANHTAVITFYAPLSGASQLNNGVNSGPQLELLKLDNHLTMNDGSPGNITIREIQSGANPVSGRNSNVQNHGAVYVFRRPLCPLGLLCVFNDWKQEARFMPPDAVGIEQFGYSISLFNSTVVVGCPGCNNLNGAVFVYNKVSANKNWELTQTITLIGDIFLGGRYGYKVKVRGSTMVVGSPYRPGQDSQGNPVLNQGGVFVYSLTSYGTWVELQRLTGTPTNKDYPLAANSFFGNSLDFYMDTLVVGAHGVDDSTIYLGTNLNPPATDTGAVFIFKIEATGFFKFFQKLMPTNVRANDHFGWDIAFTKGTLMVSAVQQYDGDWVASHPIMRIETYATPKAAPVGGFFSFKWLVTNSSGEGIVERESALISASISAIELQLFLMNSMNTGNVLVSRSGVSNLNGGYVWSVTFLQLENPLTPFIPNTAFLTGTNASMFVSIVNPSPPRIRSLTHIFLEDDNSGVFVESAFVTPYSFQPIDMCGWSVSISDNNALVGCPNRDSSIPNHNGGSAIIFDINILNVKFSNKTYDVYEGDNFTLPVVRSKASKDDILFNIQTLDRNAFGFLQDYMSNLYDLSSEDIPYPLTVVDGTQLAGKALARSQYYGSTHNESLWVDGEYDYRGISDYVPINVPVAFLNDYTSISTTIFTTPDTILEKPDEVLSIVIISPGVWPSPFGNLFTQLTIKDNSNGFIGNTYYYDKLYYENSDPNSQIGNAVSVDGIANTIIVGSSASKVSNLDSAGSVIIFGLLFNTWVEIQHLVSPSPTETGLFGDAVSTSTFFSQPLGILVVGEPGVNAAHVYISYNTSYGKNYAYEATLKTELSISKNDRYGVRGSIATRNGIVFVGAPGLEAVFVYQRIFDTGKNKWVWNYQVMLRSSDFDYDLMYGVPRFHTQEFGISVSAAGRSLVVGSPYADYGKTGTDLVEIDVDTQGLTMQSYGRGKAYVFDIDSQVQSLQLLTSAQLNLGQFQLVLVSKGYTGTTKPINFYDSNRLVESALKALPNIDDIIVTSSSQSLGLAGFKYSWTITFIADFVEVPLLVPKWKSNGCQECIAFSSSQATLAVERVKDLGSWKQSQSINANDRRNGDRFGISVFIDGEQLAVGADKSAAVVATTWDFESGSLTGWGVTGSAFTYQPTFGDNSLYRPTYYGPVGETTTTKPGVTSGLKGRYYLGTFELRPGNQNDYTTANPAYPQGSAQGDALTGTMTSQVFLIQGSSISFLIGGGCNPYTIYVELLIDGLSVARVSGSCIETMSRTNFQVSRYLGRMAQIRIVDADDSVFGHINVDDFTFDWDVYGSIVNVSAWGSSRPQYGGPVETIMSGAAYVFRRTMKNSLNYCNGKPASECEWVQEVRVTASDKRGKAQFGFSVSINYESGVLVVGAPGAPLTGFYKETPGVYPFYDSETGISNAVGLHFPLSPRFDSHLQNLPTYTPQPSGASFVWLFDGSGAGDLRLSEQCGAFYVFTRTNAVFSSNGDVIQAPHWYSTENMKVIAPDLSAQDRFGASVFLSGNILVAGAPGQDGQTLNGGAVYFSNSLFTAISFSQAEFRVLEGTDQFATITVLRDISVYSGPLYIEYATSDLTGQGVDSYKFDACLAVPVNLRYSEGCGDYQQTTGTFLLPDGANSAGFRVNIMNNLCLEKYFRYVQLTLSVPGSSALQGEIVSAKIRIDDDDFLQDPCRAG